MPQLNTPNFHAHFSHCMQIPHYQLVAREFPRYLKINLNIEFPKITYVVVTNKTIRIPADKRLHNLLCKALCACVFLLSSSCFLLSEKKVCWNGITCIPYLNELYARSLALSIRLSRREIRVRLQRHHMLQAFLYIFM